MLTRLADALSFHDIEFESEDFNRMFNVKSPDKKFANDFVDARMMQWLLQNGEGHGVRGHGRPAAVLRRKLPPMRDRHAARACAKAFLDHVPRVVYSLYERRRRFPRAGRDDIEAANEAKWLAGHWTPDNSAGETISAPDAGLSWLDTRRKERP